MPNDCGSKKIPIASIKISEDLTPPVRKALLSYPPFFRDARLLTDEAIKMANFQTPMVVYEKKDSNGKLHFQCIGNLRTFYLANFLTGKPRLRVNLITPPRKTHADNLALILALSAASCVSLNPDQSSSYVFELYRLISRGQYSQEIECISPKFKQKKSFLEAFGINRRQY